MNVNLKNKAMTSRSEFPDFILNIVNSIVINVNPEAIILFGSYVSGIYHSDSDLDLLIILNTDLTQSERIRQISRLLQPRIVPMDIVVKTPDEIRQAHKRLEPFIHEILNTGILLYAKSSRSRRLAEKSRA